MLTAVIVRAGWASVSGFALLLLLPLAFEPIGWAPIGVVLVLITLTATRPRDGLLLFAGISPIAAMTFVAIKSGPSWIRFEESLALAFLAGWSMRRVVRSDRLPLEPWLRWSVALLAATALASGMVNAALLSAEQPHVAAGTTIWTYLVRESMIRVNPLNATLLFLECLLLLVAAADVCGGDRATRNRVLRMMVLGSVAAACLNALRLIVAAMQQEHAWATLLQYLARVRVNVHFADLNAAGSYFVMMLFVAVGLLRSRPVLAAFSSLLLLLAIWISGSRIALGVMLITGVAAGLLASRVRERPGAPLAAAIILVALSVVAWSKWYPEGRNLDRVQALAFRIEMAAAGLRMTAADPIWGVGLGRFQQISAQYASIPENAHNQLIQVLAELGLPGLVLFVGVLVLALRAAMRVPDLRGPGGGVLAGLSAYVLTSLGGHPLLVHGAAYPFWILLGLAAAHPQPIAKLPRVPRLAALVFVGIVAAAVPFRMFAARSDAYVEHASIGMSSWQTDAEGIRFRWTGGRSAFFVRSSATAVRIPLRAGPSTPDPLEVRIFLDGREANRVRLAPDGGWQTILLLPGRSSTRAFRRVDLEAWGPESTAPLELAPTPASGAFMVGRAALN